MKKILNILFYCLQLGLFISAFALTLFVMVQMNRRLEKSFFTTIDIFIPFVILFLLLIINIIFNQKTVKGHLFYNLTSSLVYATISVVALRAMLDERLIIGTMNDYHIDFNFFSNFTPFLKIMLYGLCIANVLFMFHLKVPKEKNAK